MLKINSNELNETKDITIEVLNIQEYIEKKIEELTEKINNLNRTLIQEGKETLIPDLVECKDILNKLKNNLEKEEFINANENVLRTEDCINKVEEASLKLKQLPFTEIKMTNYLVWIITWVLILILIIVIIAVIYILTKKLSLVKYTRQNQVTQQKTETLKSQLIEDKLKNIKENLG